MKKLSLYIHIPFCKAKCHYCAFTSFTNKQDWIVPYIEKLLIEIREKAQSADNYKIDTIYIGGGTPSLINSDYIEQILDTIKSHYSLVTKPEITIENNPESLTNKKLEHYLRIGINRFSVGCQSLNDIILKSIGRIHTKKEIIKVINLFRKYKVDNFSLDFIMGLPFQTLQSFRKELNQILGFNAPHLSFYFLSLDTKRIEKFIDDCPSEDEQIKIYNHLTKELAIKGYHHYEVSNYAKPEYECRHNLRYWEQEKYLGLGVSAHSYLNGKIFYNSSNLQSYIQDPLTPYESFKLEKDIKLMDKIMLNLRTSKGLNLNNLSRIKKHTILENANSYIQSKHLHYENNIISTTEKGYLILNKITQDLF